MRLLTAGQPSRSSISWQMAIPGDNLHGTGPLFIISSLNCPFQVAWTVGAVWWIDKPNLAKVLRPSTRAAK